MAFDFFVKKPLASLQEEALGEGDGKGMKKTLMGAGLAWRLGGWKLAQRGFHATERPATSQRPIHRRLGVNPRRIEQRHGGVLGA